MNRDTSRPVDLGVPAYFHPSVDPEAWERLGAAGRTVRFVVVNVHNGPGAVIDPAYPAVLATLRAAGVRVVGYVDTDYGRRSVADVVDEAALWVARYGVRGVFFDQVLGDFESLQHYAACTLGARAAGAQFVVINPGSDCDRGYSDVANVIGSFEGSWLSYLGYLPQPWMTAMPAHRFCHLVHDVPHRAVRRSLHLAATRHAGTAFFSTGRGTNPWDRFPRQLARAAQLADAHTAPPVSSPWPTRRVVDHLHPSEPHNSPHRGTTRPSRGAFSKETA
jgi:hypothetical protein